MALATRLYATAAALTALGAASCIVDWDKYGYTPSECGNGTPELGEACDSGGVETADCNPDCSAASCGDGYLNWTAGERCDNGDDNGNGSCSDDCTPAPFVLQPNVGSASVTFPLRPSVGLATVDDEPAFVVVWVEAAGGSGPRRVAKRTYRLDGSAVEAAAVAVSSSDSGNDATCSALATNAAGRSIVAWDEESATGDEVHYAAIEADGSLWAQGDQAIAGSTAAVFNGCPEVAASSSGGFCILWQGDDAQAHSSCLEDGGTAVGAAQTLGGAFSGGSQRPWGARTIFGYGEGFVAAWFEATAQPDQNHFFVSAQLDAAGAVQGAVTTVSELFGQYSGSGFARGDGFLVSFGMRDTFEQSQERTRFLLNGYEAFGASPTQAEVLISDQHVDEFGGRLVAHSSGRFAAVWSAVSGTGCEVRARLFDETGAPSGESYSLGLDPDVECGEGVEGVANEDGDVMLVWTWRSAPPAGAARLQGMIIRRLLAAAAE